MTFLLDTLRRLSVALLLSVFFSTVGNAQSGTVPTGSAANETLNPQCGNGIDQHAADIAKINQQCAGTGIVSTALLEGGVLFATNSHKLTDRGVKAVNKLIGDLGVYQELLSIKIIGHTDSRGDEQYNQLLSERRARYIAGYFSAAFPQKRVTSVGLGESVPLVSNATPEGRKVNRRVEIQVIANSPR